MDASNSTGRTITPPGSRDSAEAARSVYRQRTLVMAVVGGLALGASASYAITALVYKDHIATLTQAGDIRTRAADQHVEELQEQLRQFEEQAQRREQQLVQDADAQQSRAVREVSEQGRALAQQQRAAIEQARRREQELTKADLPLRLWVHRPLVGRGLVASVHNFGSKDVALTLTAQHAATGQKENWSTVLPANATQLVGPDAGMTLAPGDDIEVSSADYRPLSFQVPQRARLPALSLNTAPSAGR